MIETSLMVDDYPTPPEEKEKTVDFDVVVTLKFRDIKMPEDMSIEEYIQCDGILDYEDYEIEDIR